MVIASFVWTRLLALAIAVAAAFWILRWVAWGKASIRTPADWSIFLLVLMAIVSLLITPLSTITNLQVLRLLSGVLIYYAIVNWSLSRRRVDILAAMLALAGVTLSLFAIISVEWAAAKIQNLPIQIFKWFSIFVSDKVHPNVMAGTLLILAPVLIALLLFNKWSTLATIGKRLAYIFCVFGVLSMTLILGLTLSRSAWIAYLIVIALMLSLRWRWGWLSVIILIGAGVFLLFMLSPSSLWGIAMESQSLGSLAGRLEVWSKALDLIKDYPLTGIGMGLFSNQVAFHFPLELASVERAVHAHNLFMQIAVDLGIPGLIAWLSTLVGIFIVSWKLYRTGRKLGDHWAAGLGVGFVCSVAALVLHGLVDSVVWGMVRPAPIVWVIWGAAIASSLVYSPFLASPNR